jgi:hypothetical protein
VYDACLCMMPFVCGVVRLLWMCEEQMRGGVYVILCSALLCVGECVCGLL